MRTYKAGPWGGVGGASVGGAHDATPKKPPKPRDFRWALDKAEIDKDGNSAPRPDLYKGTQAQKRNYAQRLSDSIAIVIADALRATLPKIKPGPARAHHVPPRSVRRRARCS